uniref:Cellulose synthase A catalytic subunit 1 UDP-forming-like n=1 Tax=Rhizophora mucronata TaxID=61149 RepID=A0A2P2N5F2_RHIMU
MRRGAPHGLEVVGHHQPLGGLQH